MADRPLRPATRRCLGRPLPHQQADRPRAHPEAQKLFLDLPCGSPRVSGINPGFPGLSRSSGQVAHVLLTRSPLRHTRFLRTRHASLDLHALGTPPAFVLSQDQTLQRTSWIPIRPGGRRSPYVIVSLHLLCFISSPGPVDPSEDDSSSPSDACSPRYRLGRPSAALLTFGHAVQLSRSPCSHHTRAWRWGGASTVARPSDRCQTRASSGSETLS